MKNNTTSKSKVNNNNEDVIDIDLYQKKLYNKNIQNESDKEDESQINDNVIILL